MNFDAIKTKNMVSALNNLKVEGKTLIVLPEKMRMFKNQQETLKV